VKVPSHMNEVAITYNYKHLGPTAKEQ